MIQKEGNRWLVYSKINKNQVLGSYPEKPQAEAKADELWKAELSSGSNAKEEVKAEAPAHHPQKKLSPKKKEAVQTEVPMVGDE